MSQAEPRRASGRSAWNWDAFPSETRRSARSGVERPVRRASGPARPKGADVVPIRPRAEAGRRTVRITGQASTPPRRSRPAVVRVGSRPDRFALWAVGLGLFMALLAAATAHGAEPTAAHHAAQLLAHTR
ncbi:MAG TPA: hypothetical protein VF752_16710 [Thermoleophilaceae bacterium]